MKKISLFWMLIFNLTFSCINKNPSFGNGMDLYTLMGFATFSVASSLGIENSRYSHTTTLLPNGKVLIVGGSDGSALASSELYDYYTDSFSGTGSLNKARFYHTATLLNNGKLLIVGGQDSTEVFDTAELYDPSTGVFTSITSAMSSPRRNHTSTLLSDGRVLITGGSSVTSIINPTVLSSVDIYDPNTETFSPNSSNLTEIRHKHSATMLASGKVLIVGGEDDSELKLSSAELYDLTSNTFTATTSPLQGDGRSDHTASLLLNGKVLIAGGRLNSGEYLTGAELYDPTTDGFSFLSNQNSLNSDRAYHSATLLQTGKVLITGGSTSATDRTDELYDPSNEQFVASSSPISSYYHTATLLPNSKVFIVGGNESGSATNKTYLYDLNTGSWSQR
ncbi:MAG: hypothetical protein H7A23_02585 [Leptospiraceae bacterium]|nr:hypothetical protein [Leptospiraceae bacterium]MCP5493418.1 hypothetical protein [Leptospiraceae bacterium]